MSTKSLTLGADEVLSLARNYARGHWQDGLVTGSNRLSLADLRGAAKSYSGRYAASRDALLSRLEDSPLRIYETRGDHGLRYLETYEMEMDVSDLQTLAGQLGSEHSDVIDLCARMGASTPYLRRALLGLIPPTPIPTLPTVAQHWQADVEADESPLADVTLPPGDPSRWALTATGMVKRYVGRHDPTLLDWLIERGLSNAWTVAYMLGLRGSATSVELISAGGWIVRTHTYTVGISGYNPPSATPESVAAEFGRITNQEMRRHVAAYGDAHHPTWRTHLRLTEVHVDDYGVLCERADGRKFVRVINSTPEPDGSYRDYWLSVPSNMRRAREAIAWTFGLREEEYAPEAMS